MRYQFEHHLPDFIRNKKENILKLLKEGKNKVRSFYVYDEDYFFLVNKKERRITCWRYEWGFNREIWSIPYLESDIHEPEQNRIKKQEPC